MKKFFIVLIIIFICGLLSADVCLKQIQESEVFLGVDFYTQYAHYELEFKNVFWNILYERVQLFGVLLLLCFTPIKEKVLQLLIPLFSFVWGFYLMSCIVNLGVAGVVVGLASVIPHGVLYGSIIALMVRRQSMRRYHLENNMAKNMVLYVLGMLMFLSACVIESLVGTHFIPWVIRLSLI